MSDLNRIRRALQSANGFEPILNASWYAFDILVTECEQIEVSSPGVLAAFAFAAATAASGRLTLSTVPAPTAACPDLPAPGHSASSDPAQAADALGGLAELLHVRLTEALDISRDPAVQAAVAHAAIHAALAQKLLSR